MEIPFKPNINFVPFLVGLIFFSSCIITYSIFIFQGRWLGYLPTVSETGVSDPGDVIFPVLMTVEGFIVLVGITFYVTFGKIWNLFGKITATIGQIMGILAFICLTILSNCNISDNHSVHSYTSKVLFVSLYLYLVMTFIITRKCMTKHVFVFRLILLSFGFIFCLGAVFKLSFFRFNIQMTMHASCEVLFLTTLMIYVMTWKLELSHIEVDFVVSESS